MSERGGGVGKSNVIDLTCKIRNRDVDKDVRDGEGERVNGRGWLVRMCWRCRRITRPTGLDPNLPMERSTQPTVVSLWMPLSPTIQAPRHGGAMHRKPSPRSPEGTVLRSRRWLPLHPHLIDVTQDRMDSPNKPGAYANERQ